MVTLPERLSPEDAAFLYFEKPNAPLHVGSLGIYEGKIAFPGLLRHLDSRMHTMPRYRQKVAFVPFNLGLPRWQDDPEFDITRHVRRHRVRRRLSEEGFNDLVAELFAPMLDRERPLWDITLIEGLPGDRSALLARAHHCMVDGVSGLGLLVALLDMTPVPREVEPPAEPWAPAVAPPPAQMATNALLDVVQQQINVWNDVQSMLVDPQEPAQMVATIGRSLQKAMRFLVTPAPVASFNATLTPRRRLGLSRMSFADIRAIRGAMGGTINDVVLTVLTGGLASYLREHERKGRLPELRCLVPVNVRRDSDRDLVGNRVSFMLAGLPLGVRDPARRMARIGRQMAGLKKVKQAEGVDMLAQLLGLLPAPLLATSVSTVPLTPNTLSNLVCTNVPGPMVPLYCVGHRLLAHYPFPPLAWGMGLNVGVMSYNQELFWGFVCDGEALPDPDVLARCIDEAFVELRAAAGITPSTLPAIGERPAEAPKRSPRRAAGAVAVPANGHLADSRPALAETAAATIAGGEGNGAPVRTAAETPSEREAGRSAAAPRRRGRA